MNSDVAAPSSPSEANDGLRRLSGYKRMLSKRSLTLMRLSVVAIAWSAINLFAFVAIGWFGDRRLETEHKLPRGILSKFSLEEIEVTIDNVAVTELPYRLFQPRISAGERSLPLVVNLHGAGQRGTDNAKHLRTIPAHLANPAFQEKFPCYILSPQCPEHWNWAEMRRRITPRSRPDTDLILAMIQQIKADYPEIDPGRTYLVGYSMGSFGTWELAAEFSDEFAAVVPISGGGPILLANQLTGIPIWAVHGQDDKVCDPASTANLVSKINELGGHALFLDVSNAGHTPWGKQFHRLDPVFEWMFNQKVEPRSAYSEGTSER